MPRVGLTAQGASAFVHRTTVAAQSRETVKNNRLGIRRENIEKPSNPKANYTPLDVNTVQQYVKKCVNFAQGLGKNRSHVWGV